MFGHVYYHEAIRRYVAIFGTLFNDIIITRKDNNDAEVQRFKVPLSYGPAQKFLSRIQQDPNFDAPAIVLPRMSFEVTGMNYDGQRKVMGYNAKQASDTAYFEQQYSPAPYDIDFELTIMTRYAEDGLKTVEQILPFFKPQWTSSVKLLDDYDLFWDIPLVLNSVSPMDEYEGQYDERRVITWTLNFTMKGYFIGPKVQKKVIKFAKVNTHGTLQDEGDPETLTVQPGLTANGEPTTDITETIPYLNINEDDDWDYIVNIEDV